MKAIVLMDLIALNGVTGLLLLDPTIFADFTFVVFKLPEIGGPANALA